MSILKIERGRHFQSVNGSKSMKKYKFNITISFQDFSPNTGAFIFVTANMTIFQKMKYEYRSSFD